MRSVKRSTGKSREVAAIQKEKEENTFEKNLSHDKLTFHVRLDSQILVAGILYKTINSLWIKLSTVPSSLINLALSSFSDDV